MRTNKRKLRNFIVNPRFQLKLSLYYVASGLVIIGTLMALVSSRLSAVRSMISSGEPMDYASQVHINDIMVQVNGISLVGFAVFVIFSFTFALIISHRIAGPMVAISAFIDELKKGNYDFSRKLRPGDELGSIMTQLHELAHVLKEKEGAGTSPD